MVCRSGRWYGHAIREWPRISFVGGIAIAVFRIPTEAAHSKISETTPEGVTLAVVAGQPMRLTNRSLFSRPLTQEEHEQHRREDSTDNDGGDNPMTQTPTPRGVPWSITTTINGTASTPARRIIPRVSVSWLGSSGD